MLYLWQSESESGIVWERTLVVGSFTLLTQVTQCTINCVHVHILTNVFQVRRSHNFLQCLTTRMTMSEYGVSTEN